MIAVRRAGVLFLSAGVLFTGCRQQRAAHPPADIAWTLLPATPTAGPAVLTVTLRRPDGNAVGGARVRVEAHMSHPGMAPVVADAVERSPGVYEASFAFTMAGSWGLVVSASLPDGTTLQRRIDVPDVRPVQ